jgi:hypothetical protein
MTSNVVQPSIVTLDEMTTAISGAGADLVALLRSLPASQADVAVPNLKWTAAEVGAHVVSLLQRGLRGERRWRTIEELAEVNDAHLADLAERDLKTLGDLLEVELIAAAPKWANIQLWISSFALGDLLVHAFDIARATGVPWIVRPDRAAVCMRAALPAMGLFIRPEIKNGPVEQLILGFGDGDNPLHIQVGNGMYSVTPGAGDGIPRSEADGGSVLLAVTRQVPSADELTDRFASWYLPI